MLTLSPGERTGVRAGVITNFIPHPKSPFQTVSSAGNIEKPAHFIMIDEGLRSELQKQGKITGEQFRLNRELWVNQPQERTNLTKRLKAQLN